MAVQSANRIEVTLKVKAEFNDPQLFGSNVVIRIPLPEQIGSVQSLRICRPSFSAFMPS